MKQPILFVPYYIAVIAKQKGFNEPCLTTYDDKRCLNNIANVNREDQNTAHHENLSADFWSFNSKLDVYIAAPTYQQLVDWLRIEHHTLVFVQPCGTSQLADYNGCIISNAEYTDTKCFPSYYGAFDYTLERVLKEL